MKRVFKNRFRGLIYIFLQNRFSWKYINENERELIKNYNDLHNNYRDDYLDPLKYGTVRVEGGENWESTSSRLDKVKGQFINSALLTINPQSVLEVGPGAGFYTKMIFNYPSVKRMEVVDINSNFVNYLSKIIMKSNSENKIFKCHVGDIIALQQVNNTFDMIILNSTVHHIPERDHLFLKLGGLLNPNGFIVAYDPTHYLIRIIQLLFKIPTFLSSKFIYNGCNFSTHHFCTLAEYKSIISNNQRKFNVIEHVFIIPKKFKFIEKIPYFKKYKHYFSSDMGIIFQLY